MNIVVATGIIIVVLGGILWKLISGAWGKNDTYEPEHNRYTDDDE